MGIPSNPRCDGGCAWHRQSDLISILTNKLPEAHRARTQRLGIGLALVMRLGLLGTVALIALLTTPLFALFAHPVSWRDLILIAGGVFLVWKATAEIHHHVAHDSETGTSKMKSKTLTPISAIKQILVLVLCSPSIVL